MASVHTAIELAAPPEHVWAILMDPRRLADWVTIHRSLGPVPDKLRTGSEFEQTLTLRGAHLHVAWTVAALDPPHRAVWEGRGPAHSRATCIYELAPTADGGTRFDYTNEFKTPGGPLAAVAGRVLVGGLSQREAQRSLERLRQLIAATDVC